MMACTGPKKLQTGAMIGLRKKKKYLPKEEAEYLGLALADKRDVNIDAKAIQTSIISA